MEGIENVLHPLKLKSLAQEWILEDCSGLDLSSVALPSSHLSTAKIIVKEPAVLCGIPFCNAIFQEMNCLAEWNIAEGADLTPYETVAIVRGTARDLLIAERIVLNLLSRSSGVATVSRRVKRLLQEAGWQGEPAGTRKTTPGFRLVEKYSMLVGGVSTHRYSLSDMVMLKDNHISLAGSITKALTLAKSVPSFHQKIEVECSNLNDGLEAAANGCDVVMLDNFDPNSLKTCATEIKKQFPKILIEASGNVKENNILSYASENVDIISSSMFVQGYKTIDFSMKIQINTLKMSNGNS